MIVTEKEIFEQIDEASEKINSGNVDGFRSYEEGVKDALEWVINGEYKPIQD